MGALAGRHTRKLQGNCKPDKEIGPKDFRKKGPGYEAVTESFGPGVIKSINANTREANDTGITSLYVQVYVSKEEYALRTMAKLNLEGKGAEGTIYAGKGFSIRYSSSLPTARARKPRTGTVR